MADNTETGNTTANTSANRKSIKGTSVRDGALDRARSAISGLEANPMGVLVGGVTVGLVAGALIPRSDREKEALAPVGKRLAEGAVAALAAAKEAGKEQLSASVIGRDAAKEGARKVLDSAFQAARGGNKASSSEEASTSA